MKAIIWGSCGSLPSPASPATIKGKVKEALWASRNENFESEADVDAYMETIPFYLKGTYKANTTCLQIISKSDEVILCDAGTGIRDYAISLDPQNSPKTYHIFISHLHWDHIQGFPFFTPAYIPGNRIIFHGFHKETENAIRKQMEAPCFPVPFETMQADIEFDIRENGASFQIGNVSVTTIKQEHPGDSWGYRFEEDGKSIIFSSDSEHGPESKNVNYPFIEFFKEADVLIFDGQYTFEEATTAKRHWGHSDHITAVELSARSKVKKLIICHHEPAHSDLDIEKIHQHALRYRDIYNQETLTRSPFVFPQDIALAYDGMIIEA